MSQPPQPRQLVFSFAIAPEVEIERDPESPDTTPRLRVSGLRANGTVKDAANHLGVSVQTVRRMIARGQISARKPAYVEGQSNPNCKLVVDMLSVYAL